MSSTPRTNTGADEDPGDFADFDFDFGAGPDACVVALSSATLRINRVGYPLIDCSESKMC